MNVVGVLVWYDESPEMLATAVSGFARICDNIVAVDGAYALYPEGKPRSHPVQASTIQYAAESAGAGCLVHRPREVFYGNEVEKRNLTLGLASALEPDWIIVFDGDFQMAECHPELVRADLEDTNLHVATYELRDTHERLRSIYRWTDDLAYGPAHYIVRGTYDGVRHELRGHQESEALWLGNMYAHHVSHDRMKERADDAASYTQLCEFYGAEALDVVA